MPLKSPHLEENDVKVLLWDDRLGCTEGHLERNGFSQLERWDAESLKVSQVCLRSKPGAEAKVGKYQKLAERLCSQTSARGEMFGISIFPMPPNQIRPVFAFQEACRAR